MGAVAILGNSKTRVVLFKNPPQKSSFDAHFPDLVQP